MDDDEIIDSSDELEEYWDDLSNLDLGSQTVSEVRRINGSGGDWWD